MYCRLFDAAILGCHSGNMPERKAKYLTKYARFFLTPRNSTHRQYEALKDYFVDGLPSAEAAKRWGYTPGSFRVLCHEFRQNPNREFFLPPAKGPQSSPKTDPIRGQIVALRKQNLSIYDIATVLAESGHTVSPVQISTILKEEGFARLPRRGDDERPPRVRSEVAAVADARKIDLAPRRIRTKFGGLFLFLPYLSAIPFDEILSGAGFPGTKMVSAGHAMRSLLAMKLVGSARHSHVMSDVFDEGLALFVGLNVIPKRAFLTEYSCRIHPDSYPKVMRAWFDAVGGLGLERGSSIDLDFHTIPFHGEDALVQRHYISKRSRKQKGLLAFLAYDADKHVFCYANGQLRKEEQADEILRFVEFWKLRTGHFPEELIFDSKLTTYANLKKLDTMGIKFITLRRRSKEMLDKIADVPVSAWRKIELEGVSRIYKTPKILDKRITLSNYEGKIRQLTITELGHEDPTILITNQLTRSPAKLIGRYAHRMLIENGLADGIDFFHMDALSSAVAMKVNCDLQLTLMASSLYRLLASKIGNGYATAKSRRIYRDFINATAYVTISPEEILVQFQKRARNPLLLAAGFAATDIPIPWLGGRRLHFAFG